MGSRKQAWAQSPEHRTAGPHPRRVAQGRSTNSSGEVPCLAEMLAAPPVTKFTPPRLPSTLVDRKSLITRLEIGSAPVTLVMGAREIADELFISMNTLKSH